MTHKEENLGSAGPLRWSPSEAAAVNDFLSTAVGQKWLRVLGSRRPTLDLSGTEKAALSGAFAAGYDRAFAEMYATRMTYQSDNASVKAIDPTKD